VYLDIEGDPYSDSYYLIGTLIVFDPSSTVNELWRPATS
jgi:hypothetical protein